MPPTHRMHRRDHLPAPARVRAEMLEIRIMAELVIELTKIATEGYEELYEASLAPTNANSGEGGVPPGKDGFKVTDPTGDVATSGMHARMRGWAYKVSGKLRKTIPILEQAESMITIAFNETDPDFADKLRRLRELEAEIRDQASVEKSA